MTGELETQTVAVLATDGFEQLELTEPVVTDRRLALSRKPDELPGFCRRMIGSPKEARGPERLSTPSRVFRGARRLVRRARAIRA